MRRFTTLFTFALALWVAFYASEAGAEPTEITTCGTIAQPGSYVLANNLAAVGTCLVVNADFVTIDLAGFLISGDGTGTGITSTTNPVGPTPKGTTVRNGTITGFKEGVFLGGGISIVEGMRVVGNVTGITAIGILKGNLADNNNVGMVVFGIGSIVSGNQAIGNKNSGITLITFGNIVLGYTVSGNNAAGNGNIGIDVPCPSNVIGNTATGNVGGNLVLRGAGCTNIDNLSLP